MTDGRDDGERPVEELAGLRQDVPERFADGVRAKIHRRLFALEAVNFSWRTIWMLLVQWLGMLAELLRGRSDEGERR